MGGYIGEPGEEPAASHPEIRHDPLNQLLMDRESVAVLE